jgi:hypothetical protein
MNLWWNYFLLRIKAFFIGNPEEADCIVCLAFGRNTFTDNELPEISCFVRTSESDDDVFIDLKAKNFDPGIPNKKMAQEIIFLSEELSIPIIVQWEIAYSFWRYNIEFWENNSHRITSIWPNTSIWPDEEKSSLNSRDVLEKTIEIMVKRDWNSPILIAHQYHIYRVLLIFNKLSKKMFSPIVFKQTVNEFDKNSVQEWTRSKFSWNRKELLVRIHHFILGWV